jgi:hypothetical protein
LERGGAQLRRAIMMNELGELWVCQVRDCHLLDFEYLDSEKLSTELS